MKSPQRALLAVFLLFAAQLPARASRETPFQVIDFPATGTPVLRFTIGKFKLLADGRGKEHGLLSDAVAKNLTEKPLGNVALLMFVFDKAAARIGEGSINLTNVGAHQTVKFEINIYVNGTPASVSLSPTAARTLSITVNSVPQGALLKVDGNPAGTTPKIIDVPIGKHMLEFTKEGFNTGHFPLEITSHDTSGGSVSFELGTATHDTIELRDGSVISGDLVSITGMEVQIRVASSTHTYDRNQIKRITLTQRDPPQ